MKNKKNELSQSFKLNLDNFTYDKKGGENKIKNKKTMPLFGITLVLIMVLGSTPLGFSEPLRVQLEHGIETNQLQCDNASHVLVQRTNGNMACVSERTAERTGWKIIEIKSIIHISQNEFDKNLIFNDIQSNSGINLVKQVVELKVSSDVEFVDDGRVYDTVLQRSPSPNPMYDKIMSFEVTPDDIDVDGTISINSVTHEKYSINPGVGFYIEDWIPTYIPDGYKLLFISNSYNDYRNNPVVSHENYVIAMKFVPNNFVLYSNATDHDVLKKSKGFNVLIVNDSVSLDEIEDRIERARDSREEQGNNYGLGFVDMIRDDKTVFAYAGGNGFNYYQAILSFHPDDYTSVGVSSLYLTLDELIPIFNSVME